MQSEMNRMFDEMFGNLARTGGRQQGGAPSQWAPALDVLQEDRDIVVRVELPGVKPEDVDITFHNGVLTISGERETEEQGESSGYYVRERRYGPFRRSISLPEGVEQESIRARFENGLLEVTISLPGDEPTGPRRIPIEGE